MSEISPSSSTRMHKLQLGIKWTVYTLLLLNFAFYIYDDWRMAQFTLTTGATFLDITGAYATSLDELAWFSLLFLFEYETYWMEDDDERRAIHLLLPLVRSISYAVIIHTLYSYVMTVISLDKSIIMAGVTDVCSLAGQDLSFLRNYAYDIITAENCSTFSTESQFYQIYGEPVVTDVSGFAQNYRLAIVDVIECSSWIGAVLAIEAAVQLQNRGVYESFWLTAVNYSHRILYVVIAGAAVYWFMLGHYVYAWDEFLWIAGFSAIDMNLSEWREELEEEEA